MTTESSAVPDRRHGRAWIMWTIALAVYTLAIFNRSSLGVAGILAAERFDIDATELAAFTVLQLIVYAAMQVPVGVLVDRFGSRAMLLSGLGLMTAGQFTFAYSESFSAAMVTRGAIGAGDAMVWVSVLALVTAWFRNVQVPKVVQLTGYLGQVGGIVAAAPMSIALHRLGWTGTFAAASVVGMVLMVVTAVMVKDSPRGSPRRASIRLSVLVRSVRMVWNNPGTRLGLWSHFTGQFSFAVFALLWGYPFLVEGEDVSPGTASTLISLLVVAMIVSGIILGRVVARHPFHRSTMVLCVTALMASTWTAVLLWPGPAPVWLLVALVGAIATGGPAAMVGFDVVRTFNPIERIGRASGIVNAGGFVASLTVMALVGLVLDLRDPGVAATPDRADYRWAMSVQYLFWALGAAQVLRYRRKGMAHMRKFHPGAMEDIKSGVQFVHPPLRRDEP